jgi:hypothetical protein
MIGWCIFRSVCGVEWDCFGAVDEGTVNLDALFYSQLLLHFVTGRVRIGLTRTRFVPAGAGILNRL